MSGLKKNNKIVKKILFYNALIALVLIVLLSIITSVFVGVHKKSDAAYTSQLKNEIREIIVGNAIHSDKRLKKLVDDKNIWIQIEKNNVMKYSSPLESDTLDKFKENKEHLVLNETLFRIEDEVNIYDVWMVRYTNQINVCLKSAIIIAIIFIAVILATVSIIFFKRIILPTRRLQDTILDLTDLKFRKIAGFVPAGSSDYLAEELATFAKGLEDKAEYLSENILVLEKKITAQDELSLYNQSIISSLIHNLKTPLNINNLYLYKLNKGKVYDQQITERLDYNNKEILNDINEILETVYNKNDMVAETESIEVRNLINTQIANMRESFDYNDLSIDIVGDNNVYVNGNTIELKSMINLSLSNISNYAKVHSKAIINIERIDGKVYIYMYNDAERLYEIDLDKIFDLFYSSNKPDVHSSGVGLHIIKTLAKTLGGDCWFYKKGNGVELKIELVASSLQLKKI